MILDQFANLSLYRASLPDLDQVQAFLDSTALSTLGPGRIDLENGVFALVQEFTTDTPEAERKWEAHRRYVDVQCVVDGQEAMGWTPVHELIDPTPYSDEKDVLLALAARNATEVAVRAGQFTVFFPGDAHRPCRSVSTPIKVRKIVVKIPVN